MKKYLEIILNSIKQSIFHKPTALAMFVLMIMVGTVACGFFSRIMIEGAEQEIYPDNPNIVCEQNADFIAIGDYMRSIENEYFDYYRNYGKINASILNAKATHKDKTIQIDAVEAEIEVFDSKFSDITIESGQKVMWANNVFCDLLGCGYGDYITFCGTEFLIVGVINSSMYEKNSIITFPYTARLADWDITNTPEQTFLRIYNLDFYGLKKNFTKSVYEDLKGIGVNKGVEYVNSSLVQAIVLLILFLIAVSLSVISVTNYWQSVNDRKYTIYKMIGASPKAVAGIMLFETGVVASVAVAIGLLADYIISLFVNISSIGRLLWLHYLILFVTTLFAVMVMVTIKTIKMAKRMPMQKAVKPKKRRKKYEKN